MTSGSDDRKYWLNVLTQIIDPVLSNLARQQLKKKMPVECITGSVTERSQFSYLEAFGRSLAGISPWLELNAQSSEENALRAKTADLARQALDSATDPRSHDFMNFNIGRQPLVDAAFLAHATLRAPNELWKKLGSKTQANLIAALKSTRVIMPNMSSLSTRFFGQPRLCK